MWLSSNTKYLFSSKTSLNFPKTKDNSLSEKVQDIFNGKYIFFHGQKIELPETNRWLTHPIDKYQYPKDQHYTAVPDFTPGRDIKYIWEISRFCYLYDVIRQDYHFDKDNAKFVIEEIVSWIDSNTINCGPHFVSSQEIALRILNWLFALYYYSDSVYLNEPTFQKIMDSVYGQLRHIDKNLDFSQKFVRNNHIITEASALFIYSILFPSLPESAQWFNKSKKILENEITFQIFEDGTYLQYSMNYHRVLIQLLTLNIRIAALNNIQFSKKVLHKIEKTFNFLTSCTNSTNGKLPNYGSNDGSLFFPLNNHSFQDFRPQLQALGIIIGKIIYAETFYEDNYWYGLDNNTDTLADKNISSQIKKYSESGYYLIKEPDAFTFIRCGNHKSRPAQADNLHVDLWYHNENIMLDGGTYLYNTDEKTRKYFFGSASHNTVMLGDADQILKGPRFIWYFNTKCLHAELEESETEFTFSGTIKAFRHTGSWKTISRTIIKQKNLTKWVITDKIFGNTNLPVHQIWNPGNSFNHYFKISAIDEQGKEIEPEFSDGFYSETYGIKNPLQRIIFTTTTNTIVTSISLK